MGEMIGVAYNNHHNNFQLLWLMVVPLKVPILAWCLFLNWVPTKDKLVQRRVLEANDQGCVANFGFNDDRDNLFISCFFFGMWSQIANWLGFSTTFHGSLFNHLHQFGGLQ